MFQSIRNDPIQGISYLCGVHNGRLEEDAKLTAIRVILAVIGEEHH